jgi:drug/metabolite transporter (DMT)-like permease
VRYPLSALLYWPVIWAGYRAGRLNVDLLARCSFPGLLALGGQILWALAPYYLPASMLGFFIRMAFVWSLLVAMIVFPDERRLLRSGTFFVGVAFCVGGFLALSWSKVRLDAEVTTPGIVIMLFCSMFFGLYGVAVRGFLRGVHPVLGFGIVSQVVSLGTLILLPLFGRPALLLTLTAGDLTVLISSSVLGVALGHFFMYTSVQRLGATITMGVGATGPFVTVVLARLFLSESMTGDQWSAGITMSGGALALLRAQRRVVSPETARRGTS